jgi:hypothetical protein
VYSLLGAFDVMTRRVGWVRGLGAFDVMTRRVGWVRGVFLSGERSTMLRLEGWMTHALRRAGRT